MKTVVLIIHILISGTLIGLILLQAKGVGLGRTFGGGGEFYKSRRGVERVVFNATILFTILFLASSLINLVVK